VLLLKAFKHFDTNNSGDLSLDEFRKAIEKLGIMIPTLQDSKALFSLYDLDGSGLVTYREMSSSIFGFKVGAQSANPADVLMEKLRAKLQSRGARGIIGLGRQFRIMDDNHSLSLDKYEFSKGMSDFGTGLSNAEITTLFGKFDVNRNGLVEYDEFLRVIRGPMNESRKLLVNQAFKIMDKDGNGSLDYTDLVGVYSGQHHPDVMSGKKTENQILQEFLETFESHHSMLTGGENDQTVT